MMERMLTHCDVSATVAILTAKIDGSRQQTAAVFAEECAGHESSANLDSPDKFARQKKNYCTVPVSRIPKTHQPTRGRCTERWTNT